MNEEQYALLAVIFPGVLLAVLTGYATGAGCYAADMNCFSVVVPSNSLTRTLFVSAAFLPFAAPAYLPIAAAGVVAVRRGAARDVGRWLWLAPPVYAALVHASCIAFAGWVLPDRRVTPDLRLDLALLICGCAYVGLTLLGRRVIVREPTARCGSDPKRAS